MQSCVYKIILLGNYEVGKTTLFRRLRGDTIPLPSREDMSDSLELGPFQVEFNLTDSLTVNLEVNDTGSIEKFRGSIPTNYFRRTHGVVLVYDLNNPSTLDDLEEWMIDAQSKTSEDPSITYMLVGNKRDKLQVGDPGNSSRRAEVFGLKYAIPNSLQFKISAASDSLESLRENFKTFAQRVYSAQTMREPEEEEGRETGASLLVSDQHKTQKKSCQKC